MRHYFILDECIGGIGSDVQSTDCGPELNFVRNMFSAVMDNCVQPPEVYEQINTILHERIQYTLYSITRKQCKGDRG